jgi:nicotinamidase-related amidase
MNPRIDPGTTAFLAHDLQNGFVHPDGAYGRNGASPDAFREMLPRVSRVARAVRAAGGWIVSTHFTLVPGRDGEPFVSPHLRKLRPFLGKGDFAPGSFDAQLVAELPPADLSVEKVAFSAFYMSRLEWVLRKAGIETLIVGGVTTNGGVASTLRDAHVRDFHTILLSDGCAAARPELHDAAVRDLSSIARVVSCDEASKILAG